MTKQIKEITYGLGGLDETKPNNNIVDTVYYTDEELAALDKENNRQLARAALLEKLGITADEAKLLFG
jgi:hypothetical protein